MSAEIAAEPSDNVYPNCQGTGYVSDIHVQAITHRVTPVSRRCRPCQGSGEKQPPAAPVEEAWGGEIPEWMLG